MSLTAAMNVARSALTASQIGIQVAGNNMANASTPGYSRQVARLVPLRGAAATGFGTVGFGVGVAAVQRQVDQSLQNRLWGASSEQAAADTRSRMLAQIEATLNELGDHDLSSELSAFFNAWSELANGTRSGATVVQSGQQLSEFIRRVRSDLMDQRRQIEGQVGSAVDRANELLNKAADLNRAISDSEVGGGQANTLRDQRDQVLTELSGIMDIAIVDRGRDGMDVLVGSAPVVMGARSQGLTVLRDLEGGQVRISVGTVRGGQELEVRSGQMGALLRSRTGAVDGTIERIDRLASSLIFEVNRLHSTGLGTRGLTETTADLRITQADRARPLNSPGNGSLAALPFRAENGGFVVSVRDRASGAVTQTRIDVDLDGLTDAGLPGVGDDSTPEDIRAALDAVEGLTAEFTADGRLRVRAEQGAEFHFEDDTSGVLAVLGVNSYFSGTNGRDIGVRDSLRADPASLSAGRMEGSTPVANGTALRIAALQNRALDSLGGVSIPGAWRDAVQEVGATASAAATAATAAAIVRESLQSQRDGISAVSIDEESVSLLEYQRQYQGAARLISITDELTRTLLSLI